MHENERRNIGRERERIIETGKREERGRKGRENRW